MDPIERNIKQHFDSKSYPYSEAHWQEAQKLIAENKRRRRGWLFWWTGGVAMILIAAFGYWNISNENNVVSKMDTLTFDSAEMSNADVSKTVLLSASEENAILNSEKTIIENPSNSKSSSPKSSSRSNSFKSKTPGTTSPNSSAIIKKKGNTAIYTANKISENSIDNKQESVENLNNESYEISNAGNINEPVIVPSDYSGKIENEWPLVHDSEQVVTRESHSETSDALIPLEEIVSGENSEEKAEFLPITPVKKAGRMRWGFMAGYLMHKQFTEDQWLNGAYLGGRTTLALSAKWSIGTDLALGVQEMKSVHFHHNVVSGYGFGLDSLVTDMYTKRAITLQIPIAVSYAVGKHSFSGMIGTRILLDAQARMQKLHYTNAEPDAHSAVVVPRSRMISDKEEIMPEGTLAPFSVYSGLRYGWMIGKGWGLETNISVPLYHKRAKLEVGTRMAADQGLRIELGVMKVF